MRRSVIAILLLALPVLVSAQTIVAVGDDVPIADLIWPELNAGYCEGQQPYFVDVSPTMPSDFHIVDRKVYFKPKQAGTQEGSVRVTIVFDPAIHCDAQTTTRFSATGVSPPIEVELGKELLITRVKWPNASECKGQSPIFDIGENFPSDFRREGDRMYFKPTKTGLQTGSVRVGYYYEDMLSCSMGSETTEFSAIGIASAYVQPPQSSGHDLVVWPSVTSGTTQITCASGEDCEIVITDMIGRVVEKLKSNDKAINFADWPTGRYVVRHVGQPNMNRALLVKH